MQNMIIELHIYGIILGRVVAVDRVVPKAQYEEAKLVSTQDSGVDDDSDEGQSSIDEQQPVSEHSDQEATGSDDDNENDVTPHDTLNGDRTEQSEGDDEEPSEDEEKEENFTKGKVRTLPHKKKTTNDVAEGRTVFIRYTCTSIVNNVTY